MSVGLSVVFLRVSAYCRTDGAHLSPQQQRKLCGDAAHSSCREFVEFSRELATRAKKKKVFRSL